MININKIYKNIDAQHPRSAWAKGVKLYALELLESCEQKTYKSTEQPRVMVRCASSGIVASMGIN